MVGALAAKPNCVQTERLSCPLILGAPVRYDRDFNARAKTSDESKEVLFLLAAVGGGISHRIVKHDK